MNIDESSGDCDCSATGQTSGHSELNETFPSKGIWLSSGAAVIALVSVVGCCGLHILSGVLAAFGLGCNFFASLRPFRPSLITATIVLLGELTSLILYIEFRSSNSPTKTFSQKTNYWQYEKNRNALPLRRSWWYCLLRSDIG